MTDGATDEDERPILQVVLALGLVIVPLAAVMVFFAISGSSDSGNAVDTDRKELRLQIDLLRTVEDEFASDEDATLTRVHRNDECTADGSDTVGPTLTFTWTPSGGRRVGTMLADHGWGVVDGQFERTMKGRRIEADVTHESETGRAQVSIHAIERPCEPD